MKKITLSLLIASLATVSFAQQKKTSAPPISQKLSSTDSLSYVVGQNVGLNLKSYEISNFNYALFLEGFKNAMSGGKSRFSEQEAIQCWVNLNTALSAKKATENKVKFAKNMADGKAFLQKNKTQAGVNVTASGLQYLVLKEGTGNKPKPTDAVTVHYQGTTIDGVEFDSSYKRGTPTTFPLSNVIKGWSEGVQLMPVGAKYRFFIPAELAYGENGSGDKIAPYSTLIFDVELIKIGQ